MKPEDKSNLIITVVALIIVGGMIYAVCKLQWNLALLWQNSSFEDGPIPAGFPIGQLAATFAVNLTLMFWALPYLLRVLIIILMGNGQRPDSSDTPPSSESKEDGHTEADVWVENMNRKLESLPPSGRELAEKLLDFLLK